ncbi:thioesterase family protein [Rutstroemia sp. NJR-2017a BBW]|nr:thioesterase family protein [Rutstroemia sp. NJR-2017a BBW]
MGSDILFAEASKAAKLDSHTYKVFLNESFCAASVPNGGYVASCMLAAASTHLSSRDQPDTLTAHFEYPSRSVVGPAIVIIEDVKLGGQVSTLHLTLWQDGLLEQAPWITPSVSRRTILAYTSHTNLHTFTGITIPTAYEASPAAAPTPSPDFKLLETQDRDDNWELSRLPDPPGPLSYLLKWHFYLPRGEPLVPGTTDMWIRLANGERITQSALAYVADAFPHNLHMYLAAPELRALIEAQQKQAGSKAKGQGGTEERASLWFPTLVMNLEVKMALPEEGVEWLAVRVTAKQIKDGRFDMDLMIRDVDGEIVALSQQVAMILSIERNTANRKPKAVL